LPEPDRRTERRAIQCFRVIRWTCVLWAGLAIAAAFGFGAPAFAEYTRKPADSSPGTGARPICWSPGPKDPKGGAVPGPREVAALSDRRNVAGILSPLNPRGPHDGKDTLELHLAPGAPIALLDAIAPIREVLNRLKRIRFLDGAMSRSSPSSTRRCAGSSDRQGTDTDAGT